MGTFLSPENTEAIMKKTTMAMAAAASLSGVLFSQISLSATISGTVTKPDGKVMVNQLIYVYRFNASSGTYGYYTATYTDTTGKFSSYISALGSYLVVAYNYNSSNYPFMPFDSYYYFAVPSPYYTETYNNVTELTPNNAPTQINITSLSQDAKLATIQLNTKPPLPCSISSALTINSVAYSSFNSYGTGPKLTTAGGTLNISFTLKNYNKAAIPTKVVPFGFVQNTVAPVGYRSIVALSGAKTYTLPAATSSTSPSSTVVSMSVAVPAALMAATAGNTPALDVGIQTVGTATNKLNVANCIDLTGFPVYNSSTSAAALTMTPANNDRTERKAPITLAKDGVTVLEWGNISDADGTVKPMDK
jgi:hypothetical protein